MNCKSTFFPREPNDDLLGLTLLGNQSIDAGRQAGLLFFAAAAIPGRNPGRTHLHALSSEVSAYRPTHPSKFRELGGPISIELAIGFLEPSINYH